VSSAALIAVLVSACTGEGDAPEAGPAEATRAASAVNVDPEVDLCGQNEDWCAPDLGDVPAVLRRPLELPTLNSPRNCPTSSGHRYSNKQFGGIALGRGPLQPLVAPHNRGGFGTALRGVLLFRRSPTNPKWHQLKTLWFARPAYRGPVLIRGRRLNRPGRIVFGEGPEMVDPYLPVGETANGLNGFREWPGATWLRAPGCYAWQIDGRGFSHVVVFRARFD
jgi:hypothetical protein